MTKPRNADGPLDHVAKDPISELASRLRELRAEVGSPSFRQLSKLTNYSRSALQEATSGKRLPSEALLKAFVIGCGAEPEEWLRLLRQAARPSSDTAIAESSAEQRGYSVSRRRFTRAAMVVLAAWLLLAGGAVAGAVIQRHNDRKDIAGLATPVSGASKVADGADPIAAGCVKDARLIDKSPVLKGSRQIGALEFIYSGQCNAGWARIYLYPGEPDMLGEVVIKASDGRLASFANPLIKQVPVYTNVIMQKAGQCLEASAVFYLAAHAPVTAVIPCQAAQ